MREVAIVTVLVAACAAFVPGQGLVSMYPDRDNTLYESNLGTLSNGAGASIFCGLTSSSLRRRPLLHFDVAGQLPAGATVLSATLSLDMVQTAGGALPVDMYRVTADWGEGTSNAGSAGGSGAPATPGDATWIHTFSPSVFWTNPGGDFASTSSATTSVGASGVYGWTSAQMAADVQGWLANPAGNFGWILKCPESQAGNAKRFSSREEPTASMRPRLDVTYTAAPSASATNLGFGCNGLSLATTGVPTIGNAGFGFNVSGGVPGTAAYVIAGNGLASSPLPLGGGCDFKLDLASAINYSNTGVYLGPVTVDGSGVASFPVGIPPTATLHGLMIDLQCVTFGASIEASNVLGLVLGS